MCMHRRKNVTEWTSSELKGIEDEDVIISNV
jgi:hypothetical protein